MKEIGGNTVGIIQVKDEGTMNPLGEKEHKWTDVVSFVGWLDFLSGQNGFDFNAKLQNTTHVFICDYKSFINKHDTFIWEKNGIYHNGVIVDITSENGRMVIDGNVYEILMIDNPMNLNQHLEIMLKYVGGGLGV